MIEIFFHSYFGFVLFDDNYISNETIKHWRNDSDIKNYINNITANLDVDSNMNIANAIETSIQLFRNSRSITNTNRKLVMITHNNSTDNISELKPESIKWIFVTDPSYTINVAKCYSISLSLIGITMKHSFAVGNILSKTKKYVNTLCLQSSTAI